MRTVATAPCLLFPFDAGVWCHMTLRLCVAILLLVSDGEISWSLTGKGRASGPSLTVSRMMLGGFMGYSGGRTILPW